MYALLKYLPRRRLSQIVGKMAYLPLPKALARPAISAFAAQYQIDLSEISRPLEDYRSLGEFFTRDLRPGARPIGDGIVSPVDGKITELGPIVANTLLQIKGKSFTLSGLFGGSEAWRRFENGFFATIYLAPRDYHHIHAPVSGDISESIFIPGDLWPVNAWSIRAIDGLFTINERLIAILETASGPVGVAMIGATNVGAIAASFDHIRTNSAPLPNPPAAVVKRYAPPVSVAAGDRLATFCLGSTVILLLPEGFDSSLCKSGSVKFGQSLGIARQ